MVLFIIALCFIGGVSASLFEFFETFPLAKKSWLLLCAAPCGVSIILLIVVITLYTFLGKPLRDIFHAIDSVAEGDLTVRVPADNSPQFGELIKRFNKMIAELERAEQQRRNLTADIAHELRTPLHIIQGNLEGIQDGVYKPTPEHINATLNETRLLTRLVNDLQTLSLAETGQLPPHPTRFFIADLFNDLETSFSSQAASLGIQLTTRLSDPQLQITADYDRLNQVLSNLVSNALRHTPDGGSVSMDATWIQSDHNSPIRITVTDTGSGISPENLPFIFDRFWRADKSRSDRAHSGLGLAVTKQLVLAHGGKIDVSSQLGKGTTFLIELPQNSSA